MKTHRRILPVLTLAFLIILGGAFVMVTPGHTFWDASIPLAMKSPTAVTLYKNDAAKPLEAQEIELQAGWNMISSNLIPVDPQFDTLLAGISRDMQLLKNEQGQVYWPAQDINQIGEWQVTEGYKLYMNREATLTITGNSIPAPGTQLDLSPGWNLIPYQYAVSMPVIEALEPVDYHIVLVKDNWGNVYWPAVGVDQIGNMIPGQGYQVYLTSFGIPKQADWVDQGTIFEAGAAGEWDHLLWGGFTGTAVKKDGTFFLYYQGAREYLGAPYDTVIWRAIGVATSQDGINFTKYGGNPVITWFPSGYPDGNGEEGATSGGATLDPRGNIALYYGANTAVDATSVHADGRLATSSNGFSFTDAGAVLPYNDSSIWGYGDELFPIAAIEDSGQWIVYYLPNGSGVGRNLGVAWGNARDNLNNAAPVLNGASNIAAWGMAGKAKVGSNTYAIFTNVVSDPRTEVRLMSLDAPDKLSSPVAIYRFPGINQATILLDEQNDAWYMYYRSGDHYGVKTAPAGISNPKETPTPTTTVDPTKTPAEPVKTATPTNTSKPATPASTAEPPMRDVFTIYFGPIIGSGAEGFESGFVGGLSDAAPDNGR
jgi:hypothetical protein